MRSVNCHTSDIWQYIDHQLQLHVKELTYNKYGRPIGKAITSKITKKQYPRYNGCAFTLR